MIRAAAKNHAHVAVIVDPEDYGTLIDASWTRMTADHPTPSASLGADRLCPHGGL
jgi:AICAR transformylase/IMP cyclohydrolase PurH